MVKPKKIHILLIGKKGQIAKKIIKHFKRQVISLSSKQINFEDKNFLNVLKNFKPKIIINAAAYTNVDKAEIEKNKSMLVNGIALKKLSNYCKINKIFLIHYSTDYVFNGRSKRPIIETKKTLPINHYGFTKKKGEDYIINSMCNYFIIRVCWVYSENFDNFITKISSLLLQNKDLKIIYDQYGSPTPADLIARLTVKLVKKIKFNEREIYNMSCNKKVSWYSIAKKIKQTLDKNYKKTKGKIFKIKTSEYKTLAKRPAYSYLNTNKIKKKLGINLPAWDFELVKFLKNKNVKKKIINYSKYR